MRKISSECWGQLVLILKAILVVTNVQSNAICTPDTIINLAEPLSTHLANQGMGRLYVKTMRLSRRQSTMNGFSKDDVAHTLPFDEYGKYVGLYSPRCHDTLLMGSIRTPKILELEPDIVEDGGYLCHWEIFGADLCVPQISCSNFSLMEPILGNTTNSSLSLLCVEEYLEVFDGTIGKSRYCGREGPQNVMSGRYLRDLYITLKLAPRSEKDRVFECSVSCHHPVDGITRDDHPGIQLPEVDDQPQISTSCWCGQADIHDGDGEARMSELPWTAALVTADTRKPFCGATLINDVLVLTSAHCIRGQHKNISNFEVLLNPNRVNITKIPFSKKREDWAKYLLSPDKLNDSDKEDNSYRYKVQNYYVHPLFSPQNRDFDVALVKLEAPIEFKTIKGVVPICLPDSGQYEHSKEGTRAVVTGWGLRSYVNRTLKTRSRSDHISKLRTLEKQWLDVLSHEDCTDFFRWKYTPRMLCAGHNQNETYTHESQVELPLKGRDAQKDKDKIARLCSADPGSALISLKSKAVYEQIGILSYPNIESCEYNQTAPALFIDTRQISNWVNYVSSIEEAIWCSA